MATIQWDWSKLRRRKKQAVLRETPILLSTLSLSTSLYTSRSIPLGLYSNSHNSAVFRVQCCISRTTVFRVLYFLRAFTACFYFELFLRTFPAKDVLQYPFFIYFFYHHHIIGAIKGNIGLNFKE